MHTAPFACTIILHGGVRRCQLSITLQGKNLGYLAPKVMMTCIPGVDGCQEQFTPCTVVAHGHTFVDVRLPQGYGLRKGFFVFVVNRPNTSEIWSGNSRTAEIKVTESSSNVQCNDNICTLPERNLQTCDPNGNFVLFTH